MCTGRLCTPAGPVSRHKPAAEEGEHSALCLVSCHFLQENPPRGPTTCTRPTAGLRPRHRHTGGARHAGAADRGWRRPSSRQACGARPAPGCGGSPAASLRRRQEGRPGHPPRWLRLSELHVRPATCPPAGAASCRRPDDHRDEEEAPGPQGWTCCVVHVPWPPGKGLAPCSGSCQTECAVAACGT